MLAETLEKPVDPQVTPETERDRMESRHTAQLGSTETRDDMYGNMNEICRIREECPLAIRFDGLVVRFNPRLQTHRKFIIGDHSASETC